MKYQITPRLLHKYLDGECSPEEAFALYQWYDSFDHEADPFEGLSAIEQDALKMLMLNNFKKRVAAIEPVGNVKVKKILSAKIWYALTGIAAMLLLLWAAINISRKPGGANPDEVITAATGQMEIYNQTNSIYKQTLSDGSIVWLSPKSKLLYPKQFMGACRQVNMMGEAFFEVTKDHAHPFIIYSGGVITRVWGTSFKISAYAEHSTEVSVVTGKVSVKIPDNDASEVMLLPKQKVVYQQPGHYLKRDKEGKASNMRIWQKTAISFDDEPLSVVLATLDKQYGMHIHTDDRVLSDYKLTADFTGQNLPAILDMLENSLNVSYNMEETDIILYRNKPMTNNEH